MGRKIISLSHDKLDNFPSLCQGCLHWEKVSPDDLEPQQAKRIKVEHVKKILSSWGNCGHILYDNGEALGFVYYGLPKHFPRIKYYSAGPVSRDALFLACLYISPEIRGQGCGRRLLQASQKDLFKRKFKAIETFGKKTSSEVPCGPVDFYLKNGFYILRDDREFPLMRLDLKSMVAWQESVEAALESLKAPLAQRTPKKVPVPL